MIAPRFFHIEEPSTLTSNYAISKKDFEIDVIVDIIIPVYRGYKQTKKCIDSVLNSNINNTRLIIISDCGLDKKIDRYLDNLLKTENIIIYKNEFNKGFVGTVNFGMNLSDKNDVILLNSDTEVYGDWLYKLRWHAHSKKKVGTVTPFSNNATICSYPNLHGFNEFPSNTNLQDFDAAFFAANKHRNINIPTAVGFCMYIKRACLNDIGLFDEEKFGKGYGEENDFCLRAKKKGWIHLLAGDTFVYHEGSVSFSEESEIRKKNALKILLDIYPNYESLISEHINKNEIRPLINSAIIQRIRQDKKPKILHILHNFGGGTERHVKDLTEKLSSKASHFIMMPFINSAGLKQYHIFSTEGMERISISIDIRKPLIVKSFLNKIGISLIHIHHVMSYPIEGIKKIIKKVGLPYYLTIHDYMFICPRIVLLDSKTNLYCGEPNTRGCNNCISGDNSIGQIEITSWRRQYKEIILNAHKVICPSIDVSNRIKRYFPKADILTVYHEYISSNFLDTRIKPVLKNKPFKVAILGVLTPHKGGELIAQLSILLNKYCENIELKLIGFIFPHKSTENLKNNKYFSSTGLYDNDKLSLELGNYNPHVILFGSRCPETYSYTLSDAIKSNLPILAPNLGAFPERLNSRPWTWLYDPKITPSEMLKLLLNIESEYIRKKIPPNLIAIKKIIDNPNKNFYHTDYLKIPKL